MRVLLSAFEPFGGQVLNASQEVARLVRDLSFANCRVEVVELPVERLHAPQLLFQALASVRPSVLIMLGEAGGRASITPERVAINIDDFPIADNAGHQPREEPVVDGGPAAYFSTLPIVAIRNALQAQGIPTAISNTAGTYVCNHVFYRALHHLAQSGEVTRAGFIHLPRLPEQRGVAERAADDLSLETMLKGVRVAIETCL